MSGLKENINFLGAVFAADPQSWSSRCVQDDVATIQGVECLFQNILRVATSLAGLAFGIMIVVGGFKLITAGGEKGRVQSAQETLTVAFVGLTLVIVSWFIILLIENFTGAKVTEFTIPGP